MSNMITMGLGYTEENVITLGGVDVAIGSAGVEVSVDSPNISLSVENP